MTSANDVVNNCAAIVFDLDGTLLHTEPDIRRATNQALLDCGFQPLAPEQVIPNLYGTLPDILASVMVLVQAPAAAAEDIQQAYLTHYTRQAHDHSFLYPNVLVFLDQLLSQGHQLAVCTNKIEKSAKQALERHGLSKYFTVVTGGDTTAHPKPHALPLFATIDAMQVNASDCLLIGDTHVDALCASNCGVLFIFHRSGYGDDSVQQHPIAASFFEYAEICR
ncbi:MAG: HAD hydrolase-like protein [Alcaligenaceae bacterium]